jgi:hypothetical protein
MWRTVIPLVLVLALLAPLAMAAEQRHSGTVVAVDHRAGTITIEELIASNGETPRAVHRTVTVAPEARLGLMTPTPDGYKSVTMSFADLRPGDFVTIVITPDTQRLPGNTIDVIREAPASASPR